MNGKYIEKAIDRRFERWRPRLRDRSLPAPTPPFFILIRKAPMAKYQKKPQSEWLKPGPKPGSKLQDRIDERTAHFKPLHPDSPIKYKIEGVRDFYAKAQEILDRELALLYRKSIKSNGLENIELRNLKELIDSSMKLDSKQVDIAQDTSPEMVEAALNMLNKSKEQKENIEPPKDNTPTEED